MIEMNGFQKHSQTIYMKSFLLMAWMDQIKLAMIYKNAKIEPNFKYWIKNITEIALKISIKKDLRTKLSESLF